MGGGGRSDGHGWMGWSVFNKSVQVVVISGPGGVQHFLKQTYLRVWGGVGIQIHLLPVGSFSGNAASTITAQGGQAATGRCGR